MVLLIVDAQKAIVTKDLYAHVVFVENVKMLIAGARENNVEVLFVRHDDGEGCELHSGNEGFEIYEEFQPLAGEKIFDKTVNSAFKGTGVLEYLREKGEMEVIVAGLQTDYCIDATVKAGFEHGFRMIVPAYANSTFDNEFMTGKQSYQYYNEFMWKDRYAECVYTETVLKRMEGEKD